MFVELEASRGAGDSATHSLRTSSQRARKDSTRAASNKRGTTRYPLSSQRSLAEFSPICYLRQSVQDRFMKWIAKPEASTRDFFRFAHVSDKVCVDRLRPGATNGRRDLAAMIRAVQGDMRQQVTDRMMIFDPGTVSVSHQRGELFFCERLEEIMIGGPVVDDEPRALVERQCGPEILRPGVLSAHPCEVDALGRQQ